MIRYLHSSFECNGSLIIWNFFFVKIEEMQDQLKKYSKIKVFFFFQFENFSFLSRMLRLHFLDRTTYVLNFFRTRGI